MEDAPAPKMRKTAPLNPTMGYVFQASGGGPSSWKAKGPPKAKKKVVSGMQLLYAATPLES